MANYGIFYVPQWAINSAGECYLHTVEVTGSNPVSPTHQKAHFGAPFCFHHKVKKVTKALNPQAFQNQDGPVVFLVGGEPILADLLDHRARHFISGARCFFAGGFN